MSMKVFWEGKEPCGEVVRLACVIGPLVRLLAGLQSGDIEVGDEDSWDVTLVLDTVENLYWNLAVDELDELTVSDPIRGMMPELMPTDLCRMDGKSLSREAYIDGLVKIITRLNRCIEKKYGWEVVRRGNSSLDWGICPLYVTERG